MTRSDPGRGFALAIAALALVTLGTRVMLSLPDNGGSLPATLWSMVRYFTILTNLLVALVLLRHALGPRPLGASVLGGTLLAILVVGIVYHLLLAASQDLSGLRLVVDHGLHTAVPGLFLLWWLVHAPKAPLTWSRPLVWLVWPIGYAVYAVLRGLADGVYPYYFVNLDKLGILGLAQSLAGLGVSFAIGGYLILGAARLSQRRQSDSPS